MDNKQLYIKHRETQATFISMIEEGELKAISHISYFFFNNDEHFAAKLEFKPILAKHNFNIDIMKNSDNIFFVRNWFAKNPVDYYNNCDLLPHPNFTTDNYQLLIDYLIKYLTQYFN